MSKTSFQEKISYEFFQEELLLQALTHSSYTKEKNLPRVQCNERLEFLGDAFLDAIIGEELYKAFPRESEGFLTKLRAMIVCEEALVEIGNSLDIGTFIMLGKGEDKSGGRERHSIIADAVEALLGAIYLDGGYLKVRDFTIETFKGRLEEAKSGKLNRDYKSTLQEKKQKAGSVNIKYVTLSSDGPSHNKTFFVEVVIDGVPCGRGNGKSKKEAEQNAAKKALLGGNENAF